MWWRIVEIVRYFFEIDMLFSLMFSMYKPEMEVTLCSQNAVGGFVVVSKPT